jgi:hypothetical protein
MEVHTCRTSLLIWPTFTRKSSAAIHSVVLNLVSLAKSCRWVTSLSIKYVSLWSELCELIMIVFSVILSIVRSCIGGILMVDGSILMFLLAIGVLRCV